jgi:integral membrane sensor domain MASE1
MLTDDERRFVIYWKENRENEKKTLKQWLVGLPFGLLFGIPIIINFFSGWYKRANMDLNSQLSNREFSPLVLIIAFLLIVSFVAIFSKRHKWEMREQKYKELLAKQEKESE